MRPIWPTVAGRIRFVRGDIRNRADLESGDGRLRGRLPPGRGRFRAAHDRGPSGLGRRQRNRVSPGSRGGSAGGRPAGGVRQFERRLRRRPGPAQAGGHGPAAADALRGPETGGRVPPEGLHLAVRTRSREPAFFQRLRAAPGPRVALLGRHFHFHDPGAVRHGPRHLRGRAADTRFRLRGRRGAGTDVGRDVPGRARAGVQRRHGARGLDPGPVADDRPRRRDRRSTDPRPGPGGGRAALAVLHRCGAAPSAVRPAGRSRLGARPNFGMVSPVRRPSPLRRSC